jgi:hypothetical protein
MPHCGRSLSQQLRLCVFLLHQCALSSDQVRRMASKCRRQLGLFLEHNGFASGGWTRQELTTASFHSPSDPSPEPPQRQSTTSSTNLHCSLLHRACSVSSGPKYPHFTLVPSRTPLRAGSTSLGTCPSATPVLSAPPVTSSVTRALLRELCKIHVAG